MSSQASQRVGITTSKNTHYTNTADVKRDMIPPCNFPCHCNASTSKLSAELNQFVISELKSIALSHHHVFSESEFVGADFFFRSSVMYLIKSSTVSIFSDSSPEDGDFLAWGKISCILCLNSSN